MSPASPASGSSEALRPTCLSHLLAERAERTPDAIALLAPERTPLTYGRLRRHVDDLLQTLHAMGVGRGDRVALVLPNGLEMAVASFAMAVGAICAPLNPDSSSQEFSFFLADLHAQALIVQADMDSPARTVAQAQGMRIIELSPTVEAGWPTLTEKAQGCTALPGFAQPDEVALVLYTSGTTSRPKLVPLTHANLCARAHAIGAAHQLVEGDRCLNVMPLFHGHGFIHTMLASLMAGASMVCTSGFDTARFFAWLAQFRPTWYTAAPAIHQSILGQVPLQREAIARYPLRFIRSGTAPLPPPMRVELEKAFNVPVIEGYGLTETSFIACTPLPLRERKPGSVGMTMNLEVAIMDEGDTTLPTGEVGEIVVRGATVMQGYDNDPMANRSAFTQGWFRTGDQGFLDTDGYLFLTGRLKESINRGGEKISPQEVDDVLMGHPAVAQAVSFAVPHPRLGEDIAAAVVLHQNTTATDRDIRAFVATRLASFKVPQRVLIVDAIPPGPTGKPQRLGLAEKFGLLELAQGQPTRQTDVTASRTPVEEVLAGLWAQVLGVERVGSHDDFFALGGDSLLGTQLWSRVCAALHVDLPLRHLFEIPILADMAKSIETARQTALRLPEPPILPVPKDGPLLLSSAQKRLWFLEQLGLSSHAYNILKVMRLRGSLDVAALEQSFQEIIRRHAILRTTFVNVEGQPRQVIGPTTPAPLPIVPLEEFHECERAVQVRLLARAEAQRPFDLTQGPLVRATLVRLAPEEHILILTMPHIVSDGWSQGVFWQELTILYDAFAAGTPAPLPELSIQYADFASWQAQWLQGEVLEAQLAYWKQRLTGASILQLPLDRPRPVVQTFRGARHPLGLSASLTRLLKTLSQQHGVTLFMTLLAAFQALLQRYTGQDDIVVGSIIANRNRVEIEGLIGFFANTLALRTDCSGDPCFRELLERVRQVAIEAYQHQDLPFEKLVEELRQPRDLNRTPLFQVLFVFQNTPQQPPELPGLTLSTLDVDPGVARFDLMLDLAETPEGLCGFLEYSTDVFEGATIARLAGHFQTLLASVVVDPEQRLSRLPLLTTGERHCLVDTWNETSTDYADDQSLQQLFAAQVARTPEAVAVVWANASLTYGELNRRANQLAHYLRERGVGPALRLGLCMERCLDLVVGLLGILKAGAVYVPLDPAYPPERLAFMLQDAQVSVLLTQQHLEVGLLEHGVPVICLDTQWPTIARYSHENPSGATLVDSPAYMLYTSGSTGRPKGILGTHRAMLNAIAWLWCAHPFASQEVYCAQTPISVLDSVNELLEPLLGGIRTVLIADEVLRDPARFVETLAAQHVTRLLLVPSLLRVLLDTYADLQSRLPRLRLWFVTGEVLSRELAQRFLAHMPSSRLINIYGTSEVAVYVTWYDAGLMPPTAPSVPIGRPIANTHLYVLDRSHQPVPIGVPGDLYIEGASVARGYLNRPALTAERFIPHPFSDEPGAYLYKTGDLVRYLQDGNIEYLGRLDHQVKIRGFRLELGEIETVLEYHPAVRQTVVTAREDVRGEKRLVAYMVPAQGQSPTVRELHRFLEHKLPDHMIPSTFVMLEALPLTPIGKIDRQALPSPDNARPALEEPCVAPRTATEQTIADIWSDLLGLELVGMYDNFFELGGHSLLAMRCVARMQTTFQVEIAVRRLFETPTVADLATYIETVRWAMQGLPASAGTAMEDRDEGEV